MKKLLVAVMSVCTMLLFTACGSNEFVPKLDTGEEVTLYFVGDYGNFEALEAVVADFGLLKEGVIDNFLNDDGVIELPLALKVNGFMVNEDIFSDNGIDIPKTDLELCAACDKLMEAGFQVPIMGHNDSLVYNLCSSEIAVDISKMKNAQDVYDLIQNCGEGYEQYLIPYFEKVREITDKGYINLNL